MRYRLYDIDRIISRTLAYAIVTGLYAGLVLLATRILLFHTPVAALFNPCAFFTSHRGYAYAYTALMDPMTMAFVADIHHFIDAHAKPAASLEVLPVRVGAGSAEPPKSG